MMLRSLGAGSTAPMTAEEELQARADVMAGNALLRLVSGVEVLLNAEEEMALRSEWVEADERRIQEREHAELQEKRDIAVHAMQEKELAALANDPDAPQSVKDYAAALASSSTMTMR